MKKWKWQFVNGFKCKNLISAAMGLFNMWHDGPNASMCSATMLKNNDTSVR
jgi:hypothetical protein